MQASIENIRKCGGNGVIAFSPYTGEEYSADPGDYWYAEDSLVLEDEDGNDMELVRKQAIYEVIEDEES